MIGIKNLLPGLALVMTAAIFAGCHSKEWESILRSGSHYFRVIISGTLYKREVNSPHTFVNKQLNKINKKQNRDNKQQKKINK